MAYDKIIIDGSCSLANVLDGGADLSNTLDGTAEKIVRYRETEYYTGSYLYTPTQSRQTIPIAQLTATEDIVIEAIPDNYGLITWNGSTLTVS